MKKLTIVAAMAGAILAVAALAGCGGGSASSSASASASASTFVSTSASASSSSASGAVLEIDGVIVKDIGVDMVGDTPNLMIIFSNPTNQDVDVDLSKFQVKVDDKDEVSFHLTSKTIKANQSYAQNAFTASPGSMKVGDSVTIYYDGKLVGTYKVTEF